MIKEIFPRSLSSFTAGYHPLPYADYYLVLNQIANCQQMNAYELVASRRCLMTYMVIIYTTVQ